MTEKESQFMEELREKVDQLVLDLRCEYFDNAHRQVGNDIAGRVLTDEAYRFQAGLIDEDLEWKP
jgi:23S rRNA maturation-related 3'-5' exoribonuclease YhaM